MSSLSTILFACAVASMPAMVVVLLVLDMLGVPALPQLQARVFFVAPALLLTAASIVARAFGL